MDKALSYCTLGTRRNWFQERYFYDGANGRFWTYQIAMNILQQRFDDPVIIETGCQRLEEDLGGGMSTSIFAEYISKYGGTLDSIDISQRNLSCAKQCAERFEGAKCSFHKSDSVEWLEKYQGFCDLVYLDSFDYPIFEMLNVYGAQDDPISAQSELSLRTEEQLLEEFGNMILPPQEHCLKEMKAIEKNLHPNSIVLIDDNALLGGGKPRLAKDYLVSKGWICLADYQQTLWVRNV